jgi:NAD+ dependent glucose-6-phosphate dehydrogenase
MSGNAIIITGANGNLGRKLAEALASSRNIRCLDLTPGQDCLAADLSLYEPAWVQQFNGADCVLHFAAESQPTASWERVHQANIVATNNVLRACRVHRVRRVIFASTNQIMGGYRFTDDLVTTELPPTPLNPYAISKLFGEEAGRAYSQETGSSFIALRIGNIQTGDNIPHPGMGIGLWGQQMWLSNRDFIDGVKASIEAPDVRFAVLNLVSNNAGMRWDLAHTKKVLGFAPRDGFSPQLSPEDEAEDSEARLARLAPGQWLDQRFRPLRG